MTASWQALVAPEQQRSLQVKRSTLGGSSGVQRHCQCPAHLYLLMKKASAPSCPNSPSSPMGLESSTATGRQGGSGACRTGQMQVKAGSNTLLISKVHAVTKMGTG